MDLTPYVAQLRDDLAAAAAAGDEQTRRTAALLGSAIEPAARLAIMNALSDLASEATVALGDHSVEVRLHGKEVRVSVSGADAPAGSGAPDAAEGATGQAGPEQAGPQERAWGRPGDGNPFGADAGDISRVTLRIVEQIKAQAERAAQSQGVSLNTWVSQAVQGALAGAEERARGGRGPHEGRNLRGWVQG